MRQKHGFYIHVVIYLLVSMLLWFAYGFTLNQWQLARHPIIGLLFGLSWYINLPWPLLIMGVWGIVLLAHGLEDSLRRRMIVQREIENERTRSLLYEKPKNYMRMRLTDDGELEEVPEDEDHWSAKPKSH